MQLSDKKCIPCERDDLDVLSCVEAEKIIIEHALSLCDWKMNETCTRIIFEKNFSDFITAMKFVNKVAEIAEQEGHHPDMSIWYNRVILDLWTHSIGGLSENDFILAAKINKLL